MTEELVVVPTDRLHETLDAMRRLVVDGARSGPVRDLVTAASLPYKLAGQHQPSRADVLRDVYADLAARFVFVPNPYGEQNIQSAPLTLLRGGGACDDGTVLALAVARSLGMHTRIVVLSQLGPDGELLGFHAFGKAETSPQTWTPLDLGEGLAYGQAPEFPETVDVREFDVSPEMSPGLGFIGEIVSLVGAVFGARAARDQARETTNQANIQAAAIREQAAATERATAVQSRALTDVAAMESATTLAQTRAAAATLNRVIEYLREIWPALAALLALRSVVPILAGVRGDASAARRRRAA